MVLYGYQSKRNPHRIQGKLWQRFITTIAGVTSLMLLLGLFTSNDMSGVQVFKLAAEPQVVNIRPPIEPSAWIVITTLAPPTDDVMHMASLPGWKVVVVGDEMTPENWSYTNCVYLSLADQKALGFRLTSKLPVRSYTRKNIGYLYAILNGATAIYDTDDDNRPLDNLKSFHLDPSTAGLVAGDRDGQDGQVYNPYPHFGQPTLWPRGFPLDAINGQKPVRTYRLSTDLATPLIQQGLVQGDSDFDAIFRLTRKGTANVFNVTFDPVSPPVFLPTRMFSPINSQNTLFLKKAFWALLLPTTTASRVCDIWRGYWAQRLLWEVGGSLGFPGANARQPRNVQSYLSDALEETQMYFQTDRLLEFLTSWSCPQHLSFFACVENLSFGMATEGFWGKEDAEITQIWLKDLMSAGYQEPTRVFPIPQPCLSCNLTSEEETVVNSTDKTNKTEYVHFYPVDQEAPSPSNIDKDVSVPSIKHYNQVLSFCANLKLDFSASLKQQSDLNDFFQDILLIILFNHPHHHNLPFLEASYRSNFPNIAYCGTDAHTFRQSAQGLGRDVTFIEAEVDVGRAAYLCLLKAIAAGFNVAGYLILGDDVLLNFWSLTQFDKTSIWAAEILPAEFETNTTRRWPWWGNQFGKKAWFKAMSELSTARAPAGIRQPSAWKQTLQNNIRKLHVNTKADAVVRGYSDIYYVPARFAPDVSWYLTLYLRHKVFLEIGVPSLLYGLQTWCEMERLDGFYLWNKDRADPWKFFNPKRQYLHPVKLSSGKTRIGYCTNYAPHVVKHPPGIPSKPS